MTWQRSAKFVRDIYPTKKRGKVGRRPKIDLGPQPDTTHTSFRLSAQDKELLRLQARKHGGITMTAKLRLLIREGAVRDGFLKPDESERE